MAPTDEVSGCSAHELVLSQLVQALEECMDHSAVVEDFVRRYPADEVAIRDFAQTEQLVRSIVPASRKRLLTPGQRLGDFVVKRYLTQGGMGQIYEAEQADLERMVALKVIQWDAASDHARRRFQRECQALAQLHETHVVPVFAAGREDGLQYVAMQLIEGASLGHVVETLATKAHGKTESSGSGRLSDVAQAIYQAQKEDSQRGDTTSPRANHGQSSADGGRESNRAENGIGSRRVESLAKSIAPRQRERLDASPWLGVEYFRSAAEALASAAEALHTAHDRGICHRDVKPSNLMIESSGKCWVIDFGLAGQAGPAPRVALAGDDAGLTQSWLGTPAYMAPEQFSRTGDPRLWDVRGLGATLYELLTFETPLGRNPSPEEVQSLDAVAPRLINAAIPRDLEAICLKALRRNPAERYATALAFAQDLRRWLTGRATTVRPGWKTLRPLRLWARRSKLLAGLTILAILGAAWAYAAQEKELQARAQQIAELRRGDLITESLQVRLSDRPDVHWRDLTLARIKEARSIRDDSDVRSHATATLAGLDAEPILDAEAQAGWSVAFDASGERLLIGAYDNDDPRAEVFTTRIWNGKSGEIEAKTAQPLFGPVAFRHDGTAIQLVVSAEERPLLQAWDVVRDAALEEYVLPEGLTPRRSTTAWLASPYVMTLASTGRHIALAAQSDDGKTTVLVWEAGVKAPFAVLPQRADIVALSNDGRLLAVGDEDGGVSVWSLSTLVKIAEYSGNVGSICSLAFGRRPHLRLTPSAIPDDLRETVLAVGDSCGVVRVWDLESRAPLMTGRGSENEILAVQLTSDGQFLISAGRNAATLWDLATGKVLLRFPFGSVVSGVSVSTDGRRIGLAAPAIFGLGGVRIFELEEGRGVKSFYGLDGRVVQTRLSPDGSRIAALSQGWQLGIWDVATHDLLLIADVPRGRYADHADMLFSVDGRRITVASRLSVTVWEIDQKRRVEAWEFAPGMINQLAWGPKDDLLLARIEDVPIKNIPAKARDSENRRRVAKIWRLPSQAKPILITEISDFAYDVLGMRLSPDGQYLVIDGYSVDPKQGGVHTVATVDCQNGETIWSSAMPNSRTENEVIVGLDPMGKVLAYTPDAGDRSLVVLEMPKGSLHSTLPRHLSGIGPDARLGYHMRSESSGVEVRRTNEDDPFVVFDRDVAVCGFSIRFDRTGSQLSWGLIDGPVRVADFGRVQREMASLGFGW